MEPWLEVALQLGALGVLVVVLVWIFKVLVPRLFEQSEAARKDFREEQTINRKRTDEAWAAFLAEIHAQRNAHIEAHKGCPHANR